MSNFTAHICSFCGADLKIHSDGVYKCTNCGKLYSESSLPFKRAFEAFEEAFAIAKAEKLGRLIREQYREVNEKYIDNERISDLCDDILRECDDEHFYSKFYRATCKDDTHSLADFLRCVDISEHRDEIPQLLDYMISHLRKEWVGGIKSFIDSSFKDDEVHHREYMTRLAEGDDLIDSDIYNPGVQRDIFIAYSSKDTAEAMQLCTELESRGLTCFISCRNLDNSAKKAADYHSTLEKAIRNCRLFLFYSTENSRAKDCEAVYRSSRNWGEMNYVQECDTNQPKYVGKSYAEIPLCDRKPRLEYCLDTYTVGYIETFFMDLKRCTSADDVYERYMELIRYDGWKNLGRKTEEQEIDFLLDDANFACASEDFDEAIRLYKQIIAIDRRNINAYIGIVKAQSANYTLLNDSKANNFIKLINKNFGESKAMESDPDYADYIERIKGKDKAAETEKKAKEVAEAERKAKEAAEAERRAKEAAEAERRAKEAAEAERRAKEAAEAERKAKEAAEAEREAKEAAEAEKTKASTSSISNAAPSAKQNNSADFEIVDGVLKKCKGRIANVIIPDSVTSIGRSSFSNKKSLKSVIIPDSVTSISDNAFEGCTNLTDVTIGNSVTSIGKCAFIDCASLESITIPDSVTSIGSGVFSGCTSLVSIKIPGSVTSIGSWAFSGCTSSLYNKYDNAYYLGNDSNPYFVLIEAKDTSITSCTIHEDTRLIYSSAFRDCTSLTSVTIGNSVTSIGWGAFKDCTSLNAVYISDISKWCAIDFDDYYAKPLYYAKNLYLNGELVSGDIVLEDITSIPDYAFHYCRGITSITIPDSVTSIGSGAFSGCSSLKSITIPDSVTSISNYVFSNCTSLESITIPDSVTSIGYCAFYGCTSLVSITIPDSVTIIGSGAFKNCTNLKNITIPDSVTSIGSGAFSDCTSLVYNEYDNVYYLGNDSNPYLVLVKAKDASITSCTIHEDTRFIHSSAFSGCTSLVSITIPDSVTSIGSYAFENCTSLVSITIPDSVTSIGPFAFSECTNLKTIYCEAPSKPSGWDANWDLSNANVVWGYKAASNTYLDKSASSDMSRVLNPDFEIKNGVLKKYKGRFANVIIPDSVTSIGDDAFRDCTSLESITIPDSVTSIGSCAFNSCTSLVSITIPDSVTSIGEHAFFKCTSLESITIPDSVTSIGKCAFYDCTSLESVTIGNSVTSIGDFAFEDCTSLNAVYITDISKWCAISFGSVDANPLSYAKNLYLNGELVTDLVIPEGVTRIGSHAFWGCTSLVSITIPDSVTSIGDDAFYNCTNLKTIYCEAPSKPSGWSADWNNSNANVVWGYKAASNTYLDKSASSDMSRVLHPDFEIKNGVLKKYNGRLGNVTIPDGVTSIGIGAFSACTSLVSITIPDSVTSIGIGAFSGCTSLVSITIPDSVTSIGNWAFSGCTNLKTIYCEAPSKPSGWSANWNGSNANVAWGYKAASNTSLDKSASSDMSRVLNPDFEIKNGVLKRYAGKAENVVIPDGVTSIGSEAFNGAIMLKSVTIPDSVTSIGDGAFKGCSNLTSIKIHDAVTSIGADAFFNCRSLRSIKIGRNVTVIGDAAFSGCSAVTSITIPKSVTDIGNDAFEYCERLESIIIPEGVKSIGNYAFYHCGSLESIVIPLSVTSMGENVFDSCKRLKIVNCRASSAPAGWNKKWKGQLFLKVKWNW